MWELIEALDEDGIYARFLAEKGEGVHHVAVATPDFDEAVAAGRARRRLDVNASTAGLTSPTSTPSATSGWSSRCLAGCRATRGSGLYLTAR